MTRPDKRTAARRRLALLWAPLTIVAGAVYLATAHLMNGPAVLALAVLLTAVSAAVIDGDTADAAPHQPARPATNNLEGGTA